MPISAGAQALKDFLRLQTTGEDTILESFVTRATAMIEGYLDRPIAGVERTFVDRAATLRAYSCPSRLLIPVGPVDTSTGNEPEATDKDGEVVDATTYDVDALTPMLIAHEGVSFGNGPYTIVANVGLAYHPEWTARISAVITAAIVDLGADLYWRRNPAATQESAGGGVSTSYTKEGIPCRTAAMLAPYRRIGFA